MYDETLTSHWNNAYLQAVSDYPRNLNPYGHSQMMQWSAYQAGWHDTDMSLNERI